MRQVTSEMLAARKQFAALNDDLQRQAKSGKNASLANEAALKSMRAYRASIDDAVTANGQYFARQLQINSATEAYSKRLAEQRVTFKEAWRERKQFNSVLKEQIALQNASAASFSRSSSGKYNVSVYQPMEVAKNLATASQRLGLFNTMLASGSDQLVKWGKNTQWAGRQLMVGFTVPMAAAAIATGKLAFDLDKALTKITKVYGDATSAVQESSESIREAAMNTAKAAASIYGQSAKDTLAIQGDLAAAGKSGIELQQATMQTSRIAKLGELEWQDAVKATISMQEVYKYSTQELGQAFAYVNAMENQTVLTSQDFVTAIPKVAGIMNALGADLKQTGTLLTAFKAAGIDAAEGANALKSINFRAVATYGKGLETFKAATGQDLKQIVAETNGETIPTLERFASAIAGLSVPSKIAVTRDVFGIYQGSKALLLLEQMVEKTDQWTRAQNVANNSIAENAIIMQQELDRLNEAPYMRIQKAVESLKLSLYDVGMEMLKVAAPILEFFGRLIEGFNELGDGQKKFMLIFAGLVALAGPLVMLTGLFANLVGNVLKFGTSVANLGLKYKVTNAEERAQIILAKQANNVWDSQTATLAVLVQQLNKLSNEYLRVAKSMDTLIAKQKEANRMGSKEHTLANLPPGFTSGTKKNGQQWYREGGKFTSEKKVVDAGWNRMLNEAYAEHTTRTLSAANKKFQENKAAQDAAAASAENLAARVSNVSLLVGLLGQTVDDGNNKWLGFAENTLIIGGLLGSIMPGKFAAMAAAGGKAAAFIKAKITGIIPSLSGLGGKLSSMGPALKGLGIGFGVLAVAGVVAWDKISESVEENKKRMEDYGNAVQGVAEILGFTYQQAAKLANVAPEGQKAAVRGLSDKWKSTEEGANALDVMRTNAAKDAAGQVEGFWNEAIALGLKAKLHGATIEEAKTAIRMAMVALTGKDMEDVAFDAQLNLRINLETDTGLIKGQVAEAKRQFALAIDENASGGEAFVRNVFTDHWMLTQAGAQQIRDNAKESWNVFYAADATQRKEVFEQMAMEYNRDLMALYDRVSKEQPDKLKSMGVMNYSDFLAKMGSGVQGGVPTMMRTVMGMDDEVIDRYQRMAEGSRLWLGSVMESGNIARIASNDFRDYFGQLENRNLFDNPDQKMYIFRNTLDSASTAAKTLDDSLKDAGVSGESSAERANSAWRNVITGTLDAAVEEATTSMDSYWDNYVDGVAAAGKKSVDAVADSAEKQRKVFDKSWDKTMDNFKAREERRQKAIEVSYDARIQKIKDAIKAEQDAEEKRKRIFEAERARIQRLADLFNDSIDINMAINSGNLDEAAKLQNTSMARQMDWASEDSQITQEDASKKRIESLESQIDKIEAEKKAALDSFNVVSEAREKALQQQQEREREALDKRLEWQREEADRAAESANKIASKKAETQKASLERELALIRAYVPRNETEMRAQITAIDKLYDKYGVQLGVKGKAWATDVAGKLSYQVALERQKLATDIGWAKAGSDIATGMLKGAFGMTPAQFSTWLNGGAAPKGTVFNKATGTLNGVPMSPGTAGLYSVWNTRKPGGGGTDDPPHYHKGGVAGSAGSRTGYSGGKKPSEIDARLLRGEGVVNRLGMRALGKVGLDNINEGRMMGMGGGEMGMAGLAGAMQGASVKHVIAETMEAAALKRLGLPTAFGANMPIAPPPEFSEQSVASTIGSAVGAILGKGSFAGAVRPAAGRVTSEYGPRNFMGMKFHNGIDIANRAGTPIHAVQSGRVISSGWNSTGYGNYVTIDHGGGLKSGYGHNSRLLVKAGQSVGKGQKIALMGSTGKSSGPHSHFQTGRNGSWYNPRLSFPNLNVGGTVLREGLANIHESEAVLTKPLTKQFEQGVQNFAEGGSVMYTIGVTIEGNVSSEVDIERAITTALQKAEKKNGTNRKIGKQQ